MGKPYFIKDFGKPTECHHVLGGDDDDEGSDRELTKTRKKPKFILETDEDGFPILPDPDADGGAKWVLMEKIMRAFIGTHYSESLLSSC
jgi:hypothetical protein